MVLIISVIAVVAFLVIPLALRQRRRDRWERLLYFVAVGLGYIMVEIAFIQRFVLFLGHPTYALTVVVFLLLLSSSACSLGFQRSGLGTGHGDCNSIRSEHYAGVRRRRLFGCLNVDQDATVTASLKREAHAAVCYDS